MKSVRKPTRDLMRKPRSVSEDSKVCAISLTKYVSLNQIDLRDSQYYQRCIIVHIFIKGKDSCGGDSGGPASYYKGNVTDSEPWFQIGIVSHGPKQCGTHGVPGVYIRIDRFTDWIQQKLEA